MNQTSRVAAAVVAQVVVGVLTSAVPVWAQNDESAPAYKLPPSTISADFPYESQFVEVLGSRMHYVERGAGGPVVFIHGNPSSSYLWRNVMPYVTQQARAIALDLIGMGKSDKPKLNYGFTDHYRYVEGFIDELGLEDITFVVHDWGAAIGFEYARRHPRRVKAIAFMEGVLPPAFPQPSFEAMGEEMGGMFRAFKDPEQGVQMIVRDNMFIEQILPNFVNRTLSSAERAAYAAPYLQESSRAPVLAWPREIPIAGEPHENVETLNAIGTFMQTTRLPMLLLYASPGVLVPPDGVAWYIQRIKNLETAFVGQGLHFVQEDQPEAIGRAIADWLRRVP